MPQTRQNHARIIEGRRLLPRLATHVNGYGGGFFMASDGVGGPATHLWPQVKRPSGDICTVLGGTRTSAGYLHSHMKEHTIAQS